MSETSELADRLSTQHQHSSPTGKVGLCTCPTCPDLRAAAAELRRLDKLTTRLMAILAEPYAEAPMHDDVRANLFAAVAHAADPDNRNEP